MKTFIKQTTIVGAMLVALPVLAQGLGVQGSVDAQAENENTQSQAQLDAQVEAEGESQQIQVEARNAEGEVVPVNAEIQVQNQAPTAEETQAEVEVQTRTNADAGNAPEESQSQNRATVRINGNEISVDANAQRSINTSAEVGNDEELGLYARGLTQANARIQAIESNDNEVSLTMRENARLFGLFSVGLDRTARVMVNEAGEAQVEVTQPWWATFTSVSSQASSDIQTSIEENIQGEVSANVRAANKARILESMQAAFEAEVNTDATVN